MRRKIGIIAVLAVTASCGEPTSPGNSESSAAVNTELKDARSGGTENFYFLPPLADPIAYQGAFDGSRIPVVEICALSNDGSCAVIVARFTRDNDIVVDEREQHYSVSWRTTSNLSLDPVYRVRVLDGTAELGHADVRLLQNASERKRIGPEMKGIVRGSTLPIKFRMERSVNAVARLEIHPRTFLLPGTGSALPLELRAYDATGQQVNPGAVSWSTSKPSVIAISASGVATALAAAGSSQITAQVGNIVSGSALGIVAQTAQGALMISDANIVPAPVVFATSLSRQGTTASVVSATPVMVPVDPGAAYQPGWQYKVWLNGVSPAVGQVVISEGDAAIGGRVVSVTPAGDNVEVVLSLMSLSELLPGLSVDERFTLDVTKLDVPLEILAQFEVTQFAGGRMNFRPRARETFGFARMLDNPVAASSPTEGDIGFEVGPFECKAILSGTPVRPVISNYSYHIDPDLTLDFAYTPGSGLQKLIVRGAIDAGVAVTQVIPSQVEEKVECELQLATIHLPFGGPIALFLGGTIPVGVGFEFGGKIAIGNVGVEASLTAGASMALGIDCPAACSPTGDITGSATGSLKPILPDYTVDVRSEFSAGAFGWAKLSLGNPYIELLSFDAFEAKMGLKQSFQLATPTAQVGDPAYASSIKFSFDAEAGTGKQLNELGTLLGINMAAMKVEHSTPLAQSPRAQSFTITPEHVGAMTSTYAGEKAKFALTLDPVTYMTSYAVDSVELFRKKPTTAGAFVLEKVPGECGQMRATTGQSTFSCETVLPVSWAGEQTIYAFVKPRLFTVSLPLFELGDDMKATITVDTVSIVVTPSSSSVASGATVQFNAVVTGLNVTTVTWSATGGNISSSGLYTAGQTSGSYEVVATSTADSTVKGTVTVTVTAPPPPPPPPSTATVRVIPDSVMVLAGDRNFFSAVVTPSPANAVTWTTTSGTITQTSPTSGGLYRAGLEPGTFEVKATSIDYPGSTGTAKVVVVAPASGGYAGTRCSVVEETESCASIIAAVSAPFTIAGKVYVGFLYNFGSSWSCSRIARLVSGTGSASLVGTNAVICSGGLSGLSGDINAEGSWSGAFSGSLTSGRLTVTEPEGNVTYILNKT